MPYCIELDLEIIESYLIRDRIENEVERSGCEVDYHGFDHLAVSSPDFDTIKKAIDGIIAICDFYGLKYESLLV